MDANEVHEQLTKSTDDLSSRISALEESGNKRQGFEKAMAISGSVFAALIVVWFGLTSFWHIPKAIESSVVGEARQQVVDASVQVNAFVREMKENALYAETSALSPVQSNPFQLEVTGNSIPVTKLQDSDLTVRSAGGPILLLLDTWAFDLEHQTQAVGSYGGEIQIWKKGDSGQDTQIATQYFGANPLRRSSLSPDIIALDSSPQEVSTYYVKAGLNIDVPPLKGKLHFRFIGIPYLDRLENPLELLDGQSGNPDTTGTRALPNKTSILTPDTP